MSIQRNAERYGAAVVSINGTVVMIGGMVYSTQPFRLTSEVWSSGDEGAAWTLAPPTMAVSGKILSILNTLPVPIH